MSNIKNSNYDTSVVDNFLTKNVTNRFDHDLFDEEKNSVESVVRVRRYSSHKQERWKIYEDGKIVLTLEGNQLLKKEKEFLRTVDGFNFLIEKYKDGIESIVKLKTDLKLKINGKI